MAGHVQDSEFDAGTRDRFALFEPTIRVRVISPVMP